MTLNLAKCDFAKLEVNFVGCVINGSGHRGLEQIVLRFELSLV